MRNASIVISGWKTYQYGNNLIGSTGRWQSKTVEVVPENKKGNFKTPNAFKFTITMTKVNRSYLSVQNRGYPAQTWDGNVTTVNGRYNADSTTLPYPYLPFDGVVALRDQALAKIYDQMRGSLNLATDLAESKQTIHMLREALNLRKGFVQAVNLIINQMTPRKAPNKRYIRQVNDNPYDKITGRSRKPGAYKGRTMGQKRLDAVTGKWLEGRYGVMPLIYSLYDAYDNVMREQTAEVVEFTARSGVTRKCDVSIPYVASYKEHPVRIEEIHKERIRLVYQFMIPDAGIWDWTSLNPAGIAWELVPLSFVADWIWTIGQSLDNLENYWLFKAGFRGGYQTYTYLVEQHRSCTHEWTPYLPVQTGQLCKETVMYDGFWRRIHKDRTLVTSLPLPGRPRIKVHLGAKQMLDSAALLHQFIGKRFR